MMSDIAGSCHAVTPDCVVVRMLLAFSSGVLHIACGALGGTEINGPCMKKLHPQQEGADVCGIWKGKDMK